MVLGLPLGICSFGLAKSFDKLTGVKIPYQLFFIFLILFPAPGAVQVRMLNTSASNTNVMVPSSVPWTDVSDWAQLVSACASSGTVILSANFQMDGYTKDPIQVNGKELVIWGNGAVLDAEQKGCFFYGDDSKGKTLLELHDTIFQNSSSSCEGAIFFAVEPLIIHNCTFRTMQGRPVIYAPSANVQIFSSAFERNIAGDLKETPVPVIFISGGQGLVIRDTRFDSNRVSGCDSAHGGKNGAAIFGQYTTIAVHTSTFINNFLFGNGAAISILGSNTTINSTNFANNAVGSVCMSMARSCDTRIKCRTDLDCCPGCPPGTDPHMSCVPSVGGAIYAISPSWNEKQSTTALHIFDSTFESNQQEPIPIPGPRMSAAGGAVWVGGGVDVTFTGCHFKGNNNTKGNNDITRSDDTSNVTFACAKGTVGAPVTMKAGESEIANPPPTSLKCTALKYSCDGLTGTCKEDQSGHFPTKSACSGVCTAQPTPAPCQVPRNCGDKNGTTVCGHTFTGCEFTCPFCCNPYYIAACDSCTEYKCKPVPPLPPPVTTKYSCVTMPHDHCMEVSSGYFPSAKDCEKACEQPPSLSPLMLEPAIGLEEDTMFLRLWDFIQRASWWE
jgi:hypothetical protein